MSFFEESFRTISTRGIILSNDQMKTFRIKQVFNSIGHTDYLSSADAHQMLNNFINRGEFCLLETANEGKVYIISLITFEDIWSRNVYAIKHLDYYDGFPDLISLYN